MKTNRKPAAWLALVLSFLMAVPPSALADDTELFTTTANPNVLLMLDITGSMNTVAGGTSVGDLDGEGNTNSRMDILWKVVYTLLNADLSIPAGSSGGTASGTLAGAHATGGSWDTSGTVIRPGSGYTYDRIRLGNFSSAEWAMLPSSGTVEIGSGGVSESLTYTSKGTSSGYYYLAFPSRSFANTYSTSATVTYSYSVTYSTNYPTNNTEAVSADYLNNLTTADEEILKARLGLMTFTTNSDASSLRIYVRNQIQPADNNAPPFNQSYRSLWSSTTTYAHYGGGTPTGQALNSAQSFFSTATANNTVDICRPNYAVLITDGEDTMGGLNGATGNGYGPDYYCGGSFNANGWNCGSNTGQVARHNSVIQEAADLKNSAPSVKLFTVGVGISGTDADLRVQRDVLRRAAEQLNNQATNSQYNTIGGQADNTSRGAGRAFFASDAAELATAMRNVFHQISAGVYSFTAPTVASVRMTDRNYLYKASFSPVAPPATFWPGRLEALTINSDNTLTSHWDADNVLKNTDPDDRRIYTSDNTWGRQDFETSYITAAMLNVDNNAVRDNVVAYVRGEGHDNNAKLGDIFHSKPVVVGPPSRFYFDEGYSTAVGSAQSFVDAKSTRRRVLYVGTNDGMLHGFLSGSYNNTTKLYDSGTGEELFAYLPKSLLPKIQEFIPGDLSVHEYYVDSSPRVGDVWIDADNDGIKESPEWRTVLIGGLRKGGYGYFALDVTEPPSDGSESSTYPSVLWEYTDSFHLGESWSEPVIGKVRIQKTAWTSPRDRWVAVFGGGQSVDNTADSLIVMDITTGTPLKIFTAGIDNNIVASPTMLLDPNGYIKFVYVADLDGSLYKFDLRATGLESDSYAAWDLKKIFQASAGQPVYHRTEPGVVTENLRYLYFGTGNQDNPVSDTGTGKFYAVKDTDTYWPTSPLTEAGLANLTGNLTTGTAAPTDNGWLLNLSSIAANANTADPYTHSGARWSSSTTSISRRSLRTPPIPAAAGESPGCTGST
ncbi:MAG: pilus assembly protein PilY [Deltaproteobacteria bacterium]|nr:pilus assembly protein PilY [Deltaproteobacteria bacterium]